MRNIPGIDLFDVRSVQRYALEHKMYDLVVYLNNNLQEYISYVKSSLTNEGV